MLRNDHDLTCVNSTSITANFCNPLCRDAGRKYLDDAQPLLDLLLWSELVGVTALLLTAVGGSRGKAGVALSADHLFAVVFGGEGLEGGFDDTASETENQVESRFL
jgi:hypothetical protein